MAFSEFIVPLNITAQAYERMYSGEARSVIAHDIRGRRIQFPASSLRPFVTREGISGIFVIRVDDNNKLIDVRRKGG